MKPLKEITKEKSGLHPRNLHRERYDLSMLANQCRELTPFLLKTPYGESSIDFSNPEAVKILNKALLLHYYQIQYWDIPEGYLSPPVPGRSDYLHYLADLLSMDNQGVIPVGRNIRCLDIGTGANCIYPLIGNSLFGWSFVGTDTDPVAISNTRKILSLNPGLENWIEIRRQPNPTSIFPEIIQPNEYFDLTLCNPPFHVSAEEATEGSRRKMQNLQGVRITQPKLNFGGRANELWCKGGEAKFIRTMILQSKQIANQCGWFTTLVAKKEHLSAIYHNLQYHKAEEIKTITMMHGHKISRIVAWRFKELPQK